MIELGLATTASPHRIGFLTSVRRQWALRPRWYPTVDEIAQLPPDAMRALRAATSARIERAVLTLLVFGAFCVVTLESPDALLLLETPSVQLPFVDNEISFVAFLLAGPLLLLGIWTYLHLIVSHRRLEFAALERQGLPRSADLGEGRHPFLKAVAGGAYFGLAPLVMLDFTYKAAAVPGYGVWMMLATATVLWIHLLAAAGMMRSVKTRVALRVVFSAAVVVLAAQGWIIGDAIARPYDLYRADLAGAFLPKANLRGAYAARANFEGAILIEADLTGADLGNAKMAGADLTAARLTDADVHWTDLRRANLSMADLSWSDFLHADLRDANLVSANLSDTTISGVDWEGAVLNSASLDRATIENSNFRNASLLNTTFKGVKDNGVNLRGNSLAAAAGVTLSAEQRSQLDISVEPKPIYDRTGQIIGQDVERTYSPEALDRFFAPVEAGLTPPRDAASLPSPADASQASDASPVSRPSPTSWSTWQGGNDSTEPPAYSARIATIGSMDAARRAGGIPASDATSTATATASR